MKFVVTAIVFFVIGFVAGLVAPAVFSQNLLADISLPGIVVILGVTVCAACFYGAIFFGRN